MCFDTRGKTSLNEGLRLNLLNNSGFPIRPSGRRQRSGGEACGQHTNGGVDGLSSRWVSPTKVRKVPQKGPSNAKPFALRFKLASSLQSHRRPLLLTFVPAALFSRVLPKSPPQSVLAPWRAVFTAGFPKVWANIPRLSVDPFVLDSRSFAPFRFRHDLARKPPMPRAGRCFSMRRPTAR